MAYPVTLIPGDGIGPEVTAAAQRVIAAAGVDIEWHECMAGAIALEKCGNPMPPETLDSIRRDKVALKGPTATASGKGYRSVNVQLRQELILFANYRPAKSIPGVRSRYENIDLMVVRENTEGLYSGLEHTVVPGVVESLRVVTEKATRRVVKFAFEAAIKYNRKKVTAVHKANILKLSDGLFLETARLVAADYPQIQFDDCIVDAAAMKLVLNPHQFDVLVMENLFGDIISDLASGLVGGLGLTPSANLGTDIGVFEAVHGTAPDIAGKGLANPTAVILSGALMLHWLGEVAAAEQIERAVYSVLGAGNITTGDLGGRASTDQYADALIDAMEIEATKA